MDVPTLGAWAQNISHTIFKIKTLNLFLDTPFNGKENIIFISNRTDWCQNELSTLSRVLNSLSLGICRRFLLELLNIPITYMNREVILFCWHSRLLLSNITYFNYRGHLFTSRSLHLKPISPFMEAASHFLRDIENVVYNNINLPYYLHFFNNSTIQHNLIQGSTFHRCAITLIVQ